MTPRLSIYNLLSKEYSVKDLHSIGFLFYWCPRDITDQDSKYLSWPLRNRYVLISPISHGLPVARYDSFSGMEDLV